MKMRYVLFALLIALYLPIAILPVRKYLRTRDVGFAWLGATILAWPLLSLLFAYGQRVLMDRIGARESVFFPFSLVERGEMTPGEAIMYLAYVQQFVSLALLLVAVFYLCKTKRTPDMRGA
jgi:hypothetical protein